MNNIIYTSFVFSLLIYINMILSRLAHFRVGISHFDSSFFNINLGNFVAYLILCGFLYLVIYYLVKWYKEYKKIDFKRNLDIKKFFRNFLHIFIKLFLIMQIPAILMLIGDNFGSSDGVIWIDGYIFLGLIIPLDISFIWAFIKNLKEDSFLGH